MKLRRHVASLVLVAAAVVLGAYVLVVERKRPADAERRGREHSVFPAFRRDGELRVELRRDGTTLLLERSADGGVGAWRMRAPFDEPADEVASDKLLRELEFAGFVRRVQDTTIGDFERPRLRGTLTLGALTYRFALDGPASTPEENAYLRVDGEGTFVVGREVVVAIEQPAALFRDRSVVPLSAGELGRIALTTASSSVVLERAGESFHVLEGGLRASREATERLLGSIAALRAESFPSDADADRATATPVATLRLTSRDGKAATELVVGAPCAGASESVTVLRRTAPRRAICAPRGVLEGFDADANALIDRALFGLRVDEISELRIETLPAGLRVEIARKGGGWHERSPDEHDLDNDEVDAASTLLALIAQARAVDGTAVAGSSTAPFVAASRVTVLGPGEREEIVEVDAPRAGEARRVRRKADGAILQVVDAVAAKLAPSRLALRGKRLLSAPIDGPGTLELRLACDGPPQVIVRDGSGFHFLAPKGLPVDAAAVTDLLRRVEHARVESWVGETDTGRYGFAESACTLHAVRESDAGDRFVDVAFGGRAERGYFAKTQDAGPVGVVSADLRPLFGRALVDRSVFRVDDAMLAEAALSRGGKTFVVRNTGEHAELVPASPKATGRDLVLAIARLRAVDVAHLGPATAAEGFATPALEVRVTRKGETVGERFLLGTAIIRQDRRVRFARRDGVDATYVVAEEDVRPLFAVF